MFKIICILVLLGIATIAGPYLADSQGFVHVAIGNYVMEASLTATVIMLLVCISMLYLLLSIILRCIKLPSGVIKWLGLHNEKKAAHLQDRAQLAYEQGDWERSLTLFKQSAPADLLPLRSLLTAAKCAFKAGKLDLTRDYLSLAASRGPEGRACSLIIRAKLNLRNGNSKAALECLNELGGGVDNRQVTKLYYECYAREGDIDKIYANARKLEHGGLISAADAEALAAGAFRRQLLRVNDRDELQRVWKKLPRSDRGNSRFLGIYINKLLTLGAIDEARAQAVKLLRRGADAAFISSISTWQENIPEVLTELQHITPTEDLQLPLLKATANLELRSGRTQDALEHSKQALAIKAEPETCALIGHILNARQNFAEAAAYFKRAYLTKETRSLPAARR